MTHHAKVISSFKLLVKLTALVLEEIEVFGYWYSVPINECHNAGNGLLHQNFFVNLKNLVISLMLCIPKLLFFRFMQLEDWSQHAHGIGIRMELGDFG